MSVMDKVKSMLHGHHDQADKAMDKGAQMADERTGGKYTDQISTGERTLDERLGMDDNPTGDQGMGGQT